MIKKRTKTTKSKKRASLTTKDRDQLADDLQSAAVVAKTAELSEAQKEDKELTDILDQLNLSAMNNRVFSFSKESEELLGKFTQVLKDIVNGAPTAYNDLEALFTDYDNQLKKMYGTLPPFLQNLIKSLPAKLTATLAPEMLAATAEKPGFDAKQAAAGSAFKKAKLPTVPSLKSLIASQGAISTALRSIVNFLKFRFPMLATGTNLIMSLAVFGIFPRCYCFLSCTLYLTPHSTPICALVLPQARSRSPSRERTSRCLFSRHRRRKWCLFYQRRRRFDFRRQGEDEGERRRKGNCEISCSHI